MTMGDVECCPTCGCPTSCPEGVLDDARAEIALLREVAAVYEEEIHVLSETILLNLQAELGMSEAERLRLENQWNQRTVIRPDWYPEEESVPDAERPVVDTEER